MACPVDWGMYGDTLAFGAVPSLNMGINVNQVQKWNKKYHPEMKS